jgi:uncharacterized membrane protein
MRENKKTQKRNTNKARTKPTRLIPAGETPAGKASRRKRRALTGVIGRNIRKMAGLRIKAARERGLQDRIADAITSISGNMIFVYVHILWFGVWIIVNGGNFGIEPFDPFPYGLLTMIVSLEAIFLSTFVLISQNRSSREAEHRAELDMHIGLLAEQELTRVLQMLDAIQDKLGIDNDGDSYLAELEEETKPEEVLAEIVRLEDRIKGSKSA